MDLGILNQNGGMKFYTSNIVSTNANIFFFLIFGFVFRFR